MIRNIYQLFCDELNSFFKISGLMLQDNVKNIQEGGGLVEFAMRKFLQEVLGKRYKVTHGYIMDSQENISPQIDLIIVDIFVPHRLKRFEYLDGLEIVPVESVVGVFEIKRTLSKETLKKASAHLSKIKKEIGLLKGGQDQYLFGRKIQHNNNPSMITNVYANPIMGIIALDQKDDSFENENIEWFIDVIFSVKGFLKAPTIDGKGFEPLVNRTGQCKYKTIKLDSTITQVDIIKLFVGFLVEYLNRTSGRIMPVNTYFAKK